MLKQSSHEQYGLHHIGAEYLPQIDENVDAVIGFIVFYEHVRQNALKSINHVQSNNADQRAFTTKLLARYVYSKCSSAVDADGDEVKMYRQHLFHTHGLLMSDLLLFKTTDKQLSKCSKIPVPMIRAQDCGNATASAMDTSLLVTALELVALEKLITYRHAIVRELHFDEILIMNEFEALYAYKCGMFKECLEMCRSYLSMTLHLSCWNDRLFLVAYPEMISLLDGDLQSLFGIIQLTNPVCFLSFLLQHPCLMYISVRTLWLYLMVQCQKKLCIDMYDMLHLVRFVHDSTKSTDLVFALDRLVLKVIYRSIKMSINN